MNSSTLKNCKTKMVTTFSKSNSKIAGKKSRTKKEKRTKRDKWLRESRSREIFKKREL